MIMKKRFVPLSFLMLLLATTLTLYAEELQSLRGNTPLSEESMPAENKPWAKDSEPIARNYVQQPPLIPHLVEGYVVNIKFNKCMSCHSWTNYQQNRATKISQTHFKDRDGNDLATVSPRRYFCTQCHVPQVNAEALIENTFKPVEAVSQ
jgi:cytochrome c-type protein NapB